MDEPIPSALLGELDRLRDQGRREGWSAAIVAVERALYGSETPEDFYAWLSAAVRMTDSPRARTRGSARTRTRAPGGK